MMQVLILPHAILNLDIFWPAPQRVNVEKIINYWLFYHWCSLLVSGKLGVRLDLKKLGATFY